MGTPWIPPYDSRLAFNLPHLQAEMAAREAHLAEVDVEKYKENHIGVDGNRGKLVFSLKVRTKATENQWLEDELGIFCSLGEFFLYVKLS